MKIFQAGMLIPWVNTAMEEEIPALIHHNIGLHWSRIKPTTLPKDGHDHNYLRSMLPAIPEALSNFDGLELRVIVLGCTSFSFYNSCSNIKIPKNFKQSTFITAFDSIVFQLSKLNIHNLLLFAPYNKEMLDKEVGMLMKNCGINVVKSIPIDYRDEIRYITTEQTLNIFKKEFTPHCDAVLFSCTALYTSEAINIIRTQLNINIPLLSSNNAISNTLNDLYYKFYCKQKEGQ